MVKEEVEHKEIWRVLEEVCDPEIPVLSILDLGIVRSVEKKETFFLIKITPTYSGCPAMDMIASEIKMAMDNAGIASKVKLVLAPAWTTDWLSEEGKMKMEKYGIAPPLEASVDKAALLGTQKVVPCPKCQSSNTKMVSAFGSTACKAFFQCEDCLEPFDYFKCLK